jgi:hypothetical protein
MASKKTMAFKLDQSKLFNQQPKPTFYQSRR